MLYTVLTTFYHMYHLLFSYWGCGKFSHEQQRQKGQEIDLQIICIIIIIINCRYGVLLGTFIPPFCITVQLEIFAWCKLA